MDFEVQGWSPSPPLRSTLPARSPSISRWCATTIAPPAYAASLVPVVTLPTRVEKRTGEMDDRCGKPAVGIRVLPSIFLFDRVVALFPMKSLYLYGELFYTVFKADLANGREGRRYPHTALEKNGNGTQMKILEGFLASNPSTKSFSKARDSPFTSAYHKETGQHCYPTFARIGNYEIYASTFPIATMAEESRKKGTSKSARDTCTQIVAHNTPVEDSQYVLRSMVQFYPYCTCLATTRKTLEMKSSVNANQPDYLPTAP